MIQGVYESKSKLKLILLTTVLSAQFDSVEKAISFVNELSVLLNYKISKSEPTGDSAIPRQSDFLSILFISTY